MNGVLTTVEESFPLAPLAVTETPVPVVPEGKGRQKHILPGFRITLGVTVFYLTALVLLPLSALLLKTVTPTADYPSIGKVVRHVFQVVTATRSLDSYRVSFGIAFAAALINGVFGFVAAWALTRYKFPGCRIVDALVDLPFAMPTARGPGLP